MKEELKEENKKTKNTHKNALIQSCKMGKNKTRFVFKEFVYKMVLHSIVTNKIASIANKTM